MDTTRRLSRRGLLTRWLSVSALAALAGCADDGSEDRSGSDDPNTEGTAETEEVDNASIDDLDLREANVVEVSLDEENGTYTFDVTLYHDDDGEDGYANWWQLEQLDGTRLGRRELSHAHSEQPFTRSETIEIPEDVTCVVVRGHDQTHGYGGVAALFDLESKARRLFDQGSTKRSFDDSDCP